MEGTVLSNQEKIRIPGEKETFKYLGISESDTIKQVEMKKYLRRTRKLLEISKNLIKGINSWVVTLVRMDERRTQTNGPEGEKTNDVA